MAPKRTTRANPATTTTTTTTSVIDAQLEVLIMQGVARVLVARARRTEQVTRECTYPDFMKCKPLNFKGTDKVVRLNKYYPRGEIKKLEFEMYNLKVKGTDVVAYSQRFQELALMCDRMFPKEIDKVEKYVDGLPDMIHSS
nr:reverse transcriptase domain-containing protein [Tanacetum cinerariifolium]